MNVDYVLKVLNMTTSAGNQFAFGMKCDDLTCFYGYTVLSTAKVRNL